jgi:predicted XRE-type DNA-binding protein
MKKDPDTRVKRGTKNVFADLGFPDAETHLLKAELVTRIQGVITAQELTQVAAAKRMGLSQPDVSRLLNGPAWTHEQRRQSEYGAIERSEIWGALCAALRRYVGVGVPEK